MSAVQVKVRLITSAQTGEQVVVKVYSAIPSPFGTNVLSRTTGFKHMKSYRGGPENAVRVVATMLGDELADRFGDTEDPDTIGKTAVKAFKEALARAERQGFNKQRVEVDEDLYVASDVAEGLQET